MRTMRLIGIFILLFSCATSAKDKSNAEKVIAEKDSETVQWTEFVNGDSHTYSDTTSFIKYRTGPHTTTHLTMVCKMRWVWDKCFNLFAGQTYDARFDYKHKEIFIMGQLEGNLKPLTTFKNRAINIVYEEEN